MKWRGRSWDDLRPRVLTGAVLTVLGTLVIWLGGWPYLLSAALVVAVMSWELATMLAPARRAEAVQIALLAAAALLLAQWLPGLFTLPLLIAPALVGASLLRRHPVVFAAYCAAILAFGYGMLQARNVHGVDWLLWLVFTVVATDVAGYFGGRSIGGLKFWPRVSPKKTWAGILCGWAAAAALGAIFAAITGAGVQLVWISVLLSFASQMGDIAESAIKRLAGVKDSSTLLPGHGGLMDRFDGLLGGALFMLAAAWLLGVPDIAV